MLDERSLELARGSATSFQGLAGAPATGAGSRSLEIACGPRVGPGSMPHVPLVALHAELGPLDATLEDLGSAAAWDQVHRVRPRAPLTCRGCGQGLQAKVSKLGLRFFAHDAATAGCPSNGETPAHRLLKSVLAAAIRSAGRTAELEVPGDGWRTDVLGVSPDGHRRVAWEAQLASALCHEEVAEHLHVDVRTVRPRASWPLRRRRRTT